MIRLTFKRESHTLHVPLAKSSIARVSAFLSRLADALDAKGYDISEEIYSGGDFVGFTARLDSQWIEIRARDIQAVDGINGRDLMDWWRDYSGIDDDDPTQDLPAVRVS